MHHCARAKTRYTNFCLFFSNTPIFQDFKSVNLKNIAVTVNKKKIERPTGHNYYSASIICPVILMQKIQIEIITEQEILQFMTDC